jgi:aminopeptidase-like protein
VDICGNGNDILLQKAFDREHPINRIAHLAIHGIGESYRKGEFRNTIGSDEYVFNDPLIGIPGIMLSTWPYNEYHTDADTPDKINYDSIEKMQKVIQGIIDIEQKNFIPKREFSGPLHRSKYHIETPNKQVNLSWDYFFYSMDGKKTLVDLCCDFGLSFDYVYQLMLKMEENGDISRVNTRKTKVTKTSK